MIRQKEMQNHIDLLYDMMCVICIRIGGNTQMQMRCNMHVEK